MKRKAFTPTLLPAKKIRIGQQIYLVLEVTKDGYKIRRAPVEPKPFPEWESKVFTWIPNVHQEWEIID